MGEKLPHPQPCLGPRRRGIRAGGASARVADALRRAHDLGASSAPSSHLPADDRAAAEAIQRARDALLQATRTAPAAASASIYETVIELQSLGAELQERMLRARIERLLGLHTALRRLHDAHSIAELLHRAASELCDTCGFDRAVVSRVEDAHMVVEAAHFAEDPGGAETFMTFARSIRPPLSHLVLESEMVRRRRPLLVQDAQGDPRAIVPLVRAGDATSYVAAPILVDDRVIGFVHADRHGEPVAVDEIDRDWLWCYAEGVALAAARVFLLRRLRAEQDAIRRLATVAQEFPADLDPAAGPAAAVARAPHPASTVGFSDLSRRETDVLALITAGCTNQQIGARLAISEATVKTHVKRLLRKLGAANRAEAAARYADHASRPAERAASEHG